MPKPPTTLSGTTKHLTNAQREARQDAEAACLPARALDAAKPPKSLVRDAAAQKYWRATLDRMDGILLLDELDTDILSVYCAQLSRRDKLNRLCRELMVSVDGKDMEQDDRLAQLDKLDGLLKKLQKQEADLLQYAERLGLTPSGRVRLARTRAERAAAGEGDDLYGD